MPATFNIQIKADPSGAVGASSETVRALEAVKAKGLEVNATLRSIFGFYAIKEAVSSIYHMADGYTILQNKLRVVTSDTENLATMTKRTYDIAQEVRVPWETVANTFARATRSAQALGKSQEDILSFTRSISEASVVSGVTSKEANAGLIQLSQGLAAGVLRGQDLRAVIEDVPYVAQQIAKGLGVTVGKLRELGTQGKLTAEQVFAAIKKQAPEIAAAFEKTIPTVGQAFDQLRNAAMKFFGEAGTGSGVLTTIASTIKFISKNFETFGKLLMTVLEVFAGFYIITGIIKLFEALKVVLMENPFTALIVVLALVISFIRQFSDEWKTNDSVMIKGKRTFVTVGDDLRALWRIVKELGTAITDFFIEPWKALVNSFSTGIDDGGIELSLDNVIRMLVAFIEAAKTIMSHLGQFITTMFGAVPVILAAAFDREFSTVTDALVVVINKLITLYNKVRDLGQGIKHKALEFVPGTDENAGRRAGSEIEEYKAEIESLKYTASMIGGSNWKSNVYKNPTLQGMIDQIDELQKKSSRAQETVDAMTRKYAPITPVTPVDGRTVHRDLAGAGAAAQADTSRLINEMNDDVQKGLGDYDQMRKEEAKKRALSEKNTKVDGGGDALPPGAGKEKKDHLLQQLEALVKRSNEVSAALEKIREARELLKDPRAEGILESVLGTTSAKVMADLIAREKDHIFVLDAWIRKSKERTAAMHGSNEEERIAKELETALESIRQKGYEMSEDGINQLKKQIELEQHRADIWAIEKTLIENADGAVKKYHDSLEALNNLKIQSQAQKAAGLVPTMSDQNISAEFDKITASYSQTNDAAYTRWQEKMAKIDPFGSGWTNATTKIKNDLLDISKTVESVVTQAFQNLENFVVDSAMTGSLSWKSLIAGMEKSLDELAFKILANYILKKIFSDDGSISLTGAKLPGGDGGGGVDAISGAGSSALGGGGGGGGGGDLGGGFSPTTGDGGINPVGGGDYSGYRYQGSSGYGSGFHTVPMQNVNYVTQAPPPPQAPTPATVVKPQVTINNSYDKRALLQHLDSPDGRTMIANIIRTSPGRKT
jgi:lambda family phage tail tape measure protein